MLAASVRVLAHERDARHALHQFLATVPDALGRWRASHGWEAVTTLRPGADVALDESALPVVHYGGAS
ncbi:MAG: hypothetical protein GC157_14610 [Frankiales bacterium]|nr:hypothetical protein [Frankiales bacterium]